jgi:hypothetical protein
MNTAPDDARLRAINVDARWLTASMRSMQHHERPTVTTTACIIYMHIMARSFTTLINEHSDADE